MDYSNLQLRSKTFLDFTDDPKIIDEVIEGHSEADIASFIGSLHPDNAPAAEENRVRTFMGFADFCKDKKLVDAIIAEFGDDYNSVMNE